MRLTHRIDASDAKGRAARSAAEASADLRAGTSARAGDIFAAISRAQDLVEGMSTGSPFSPQAGAPASREICIANDLSEIARVADLVDEFGASHRFPNEVVVALNVSLDEILNNIISYGYDDAGRHDILVRLELGHGKVEAVVEDDGKPFNPLTVAPPDFAGRPREDGGVGLHFVRKLTDELTYTRGEGVNRLRLMKRLAE
jgi:anti-sigma regulatory factor (Ser/Thr protein kinase)